MAYSAGGCRSCQSSSGLSGPVVPMSSQWNQYQGPRSVVPMMTPQPQNMIAPQRADMYYMNNAPSNQMMTSYTASQQMMNTSDVGAYNRYVSRPPNDVQYTMNGSSGGYQGDYPTDGWNGNWRQSSRAYREMPGQQPAVQQQIYPAAPAPGQMMIGHSGSYSAW